VSPGDPIPGTTDRTFHPWARPLRFSESGELLFIALDDPGIGSSDIDNLLIRGDETGALDILLDEDRPLPLDGVEYGFRIVNVESNAHGDVIALLRLFGVDSDDSGPSARDAVVTLRGEGTWLPLVMPGEQIQVEPGVWRTVSYISPFSEGPTARSATSGCSTTAGSSCWRCYSRTP
jgi:hypothetical protein